MTEAVSKNQGIHGPSVKYPEEEKVKGRSRHIKDKRTTP